MRRFHRVLAVAAFGAAMIAGPAAAGAGPDLFDHHRTTPGGGVQAAGEDHFPYDYFPYDQPPEEGWLPVH